MININQRKNIIIIKTDQQRFDTLGCMGHPTVKTPELDTLAADGIRFDNAYCVSPLCVPSRTSFFTGQYVHRTGSVTNGMCHHIHPETGSLLDILKDNGYKLALTGKNHAFDDDCLERNFVCREEYSHWGKTHGHISESDRKVTAWLGRETRFPHAADGDLGKMEGLIDEVMPFPEEECPTYRIAEDAITFLDSAAQDDAPFMLHCSFPEPHWPNVICETWYSMYGLDDIELEEFDHDWNDKPFAHWVQSRAYDSHLYSKDEVKRIVATYLAQVSFIDKAVGMVLDRLKQLGVYDDSIIVFCSDHGDYAGRYGLVAKTKAFYDSLIRIPLLMKFPGLDSCTVQAELSNIDILPTILDYLGYEVPENIGGRSFLPVLTGKVEMHRDEIFSEVGSPGAPPPPLSPDEFAIVQRQQERERGIFWFCDYTVLGRSVMIRKDNWKYCYYVGDREELYDLTEDPMELNNLADVPELSDKKADLKARLTAWLGKLPTENDPGLIFS